MKTKRIIALAISVAILVCMLVSCSGVSAAQMVEDADKALLNTPYKLDMDMEVTCNDKEFSKYFTDFNIDSEMYVDGQNCQMKLNIAGLGMDVTCVENDAYCIISLFGQDVKMMASVTEEQRSEIFDLANSVDTNLGVVDFDNVSMSENDKGQFVITCTGLKIEAVDKYIEQYELGDDTDVSIDDITVEAVIEDGKYVSMSVIAECEYEFSGKAVVCEMKTVMEFDYESAKKIKAPSDANAYTKVDFDELFGD